MKSQSDCGFSCTYAKQRTYVMLDNLLTFSEYDPKNALDVIEDISKNVEYARRIIKARNQS
jgi:hypothetical protein